MMTKLVTGHTVFKKGKFQIFRIKNGYRFGSHIAYSQRAFKPGIRKKLLCIGLIWFELEITLKEDAI